MIIIWVCPNMGYTNFHVVYYNVAMIFPITWPSLGVDYILRHTHIIPKKKKHTQHQMTFSPQSSSRPRNAKSVCHTYSAKPHGGIVLRPTVTVDN